MECNTIVQLALCSFEDRLPRDDVQSRVHGVCVRHLLKGLPEPQAQPLLEMLASTVPNLDVTIDESSNERLIELVVEQCNAGLLDDGRKKVSLGLPISRISTTGPRRVSIAPLGSLLLPPGFNEITQRVPIFANATVVVATCGHGCRAVCKVLPSWE